MLTDWCRSVNSREPKIRREFSRLVGVGVLCRDSCGVLSVLGVHETIGVLHSKVRGVLSVRQGVPFVLRAEVRGVLSVLAVH